MAHEFVGVVLKHLAQMGGHHSGNIHDGVTPGLGLFPLHRFDPDGVETECWILTWNAGNGLFDVAGIDGHVPVHVDLRFGNGGTHETDAVGAGTQVQVVPDAHGGDEKTQVLGKPLAHTFYAAHELTILVTVHQGYEPIAHIQGDGVGLPTSSQLRSLR